MDLTHIYFLQEIGEKSNQEDYIWPLAGSASLHDKVFIVCDGVGGSENGEIASRIISEYVGNAILKLDKPEMSGAVINELLLKARQVLVQYAVDNGLNTDMGTTFTLLVLSADKAFIAWCGDSRIYHIRNGEILYKTADHSLVNSLVKSGEITEEEALIHPRRNLILRAIKADETSVEADYHFIENLMEGDYLILCTDGLLENITDKHLKLLLIRNDNENIDLIKSFQELCLGKTKDNYSMYLLRTGVFVKPAFYKKKIVILSLLLVMLISAFAVTLGRYFAKKQQNSVTPIIVHPANKIRQVVNDSSKKPERLKPVPETWVGQPSGKVPEASKMQDSLSHNKTLNKITKDSTAFINIDSSELR